MFNRTKNVINLTAESFENVIKQKPTLVDFWADWCVPCRIQSPILEEIASEMKDKVTVAKINVEKFQALASRYGVRSIPTMLLFKNGRMVKQFVGVQQKQTLLNAFDRMFL
ncbi:MAG TPA: thioredoxin [Bacteroidales bacterium]|nr:thioredoxin [Bacteroidales bacterium]